MSEPTDALDVKAISERYFEKWRPAIPTRSPPSTRRTRSSGPTSHGAESGPQRDPRHVRRPLRALPRVLIRDLPGAVRRRFLDPRLGPDLPAGGDRGAQRFDCLDVVNLSPEGLVARKDTFIDMVQLQAAIPQISEQLDEVTA